VATFLKYEAGNRKMKRKFNNIFNMNPEKTDNKEPLATEPEQGQSTDPSEGAEETTGEQSADDRYNQLNDKYLRLYSDFENYRKRTAKEKTDWSKYAAEELFKALLPVLDDFERGIRSINETKDVDAIREGINLVFHKFKATLQQKGLEGMESAGKPFDADLHEAITNVPAPSEEMKGKVVEELEKGYSLNGKVIRFAKVVVGN
jgi:molecular chaperone GrpE